MGKYEILYVIPVMLIHHKHKWEGMDRASKEYKMKKEEAADFLWRAIEEYVPDARKRAIPGTVQIGTREYTSLSFCFCAKHHLLRAYATSINS